MLGTDELRLFEDMPGPVVAVEDDGLISFANPQALDLLGWDRSLLGRPLTTIIPERLQPRHREGFHRYVKTGVSHLQGGTVRVPAKRRDGSERDVDLTIRVFRRPDGTKLVSAVLSAAALGRPPHGLRVLEDALTQRLYQLI
jgi:PAS domain S-box-containing protein